MVAEMTNQASRAYEPMGGAMELFLSREPRIAYVGPSDTGKTRADCEKSWWVATEYPGSRQLWVRQTRASLTQSVLVTFEKRVVPEGSPILHGASRAQRTSYVFPNGSEIVLTGLDEPTKTRSGEYDRVIVFEASETREDDVEELFRCLRNGMTPYPQLILETNPASPSHWIKAAIDGGRYALITARHSDNPSITPERMDTLKRMTGPRYARLYLGQWAGADGLVYDNWDRSIHVAEFEFRPARVVVGVDDGFTNPFVALRIEVDGDGRVHVAAEEYKSGLQVSDRVRAIESLGEGAEYIAIDPSSPDLIAACRAIGLPARKANNDVRAGINRVAERLSVARDGKPRLTIAPACKNLIREIESYEWESDRPKDTPKKEHDHAPDALRYACMYLDRMGGSEVIHAERSVAVAASLRAEREAKYSRSFLAEMNERRKDLNWGFDE